MKAIWNNTIIAESDNTVVVENNHYFPRDSIKKEYFKSSSHETICPWKGTASYFTIEVDGKENKNAAWFYPAPKDAAMKIKNKIAFWHGVKIEK